jgi:SAM-dependent methyltransferase
MLTRPLRILRRLGVIDPAVGALRRLGLLKPVYRVYEKSLALGAAADSEAAGEIRLPPPELRVLVAGTPDAGWFLRFGRSMFGLLQASLRRGGLEPTELSKVLEFGCGCGRVLQHWHNVPGPRLYGCDYNPRLIEWCKSNLPYGQFELNRLEPPLPYPDGAFDCVYAISVFTHMAEPLQRQWQAELARVLGPGGALLLTTQGESFRPELSPSERERFDAGELVVRFDEASGMNLCSAYHPPAYMQRWFGDGFARRDFVPAGSQPDLFQDLHLFVRQS